MKKLSIILMLSLVLLPIVWNGASLFHYVFEHTHLFCMSSEDDHEHTSTDHCLNICHLNQDQDSNHLLSKVEFYELKQYISPSSLSSIPSLSLTSAVTDALLSNHYDRTYAAAIFHPPIG